MKRRMKRSLFIVLGVLVLGAIVAGNFMPKKSSKGAEVRTEAAQSRRIEAWVRAPGRVQPVTMVEVSSNVMGRVSRIAVHEGQRVRKGDLLLHLDDERYRSIVQQARAMIQSAEAQRTLADAEAKEAGQTRERLERLAEQHLASDQDLTAGRTRHEVAVARASSSAEEVRRARASLEQAEKDLRETVFVAPMDGVVTELNVEEGENVITGTMNNAGTVILALSDLSAMEVEANVDETDVVSVCVGHPARVTVDALPDTLLSGKVTRVGQSGRLSQGTAQEATNFEVGVLIESPPAALRPGMNADVEIQTGIRDSTLCVPLQALTARPPAVIERWMKKREGKDETSGESADTSLVDTRNLTEGIFLLNEGKAEFVPVTLGLRGETHVELLAAGAIEKPVIVGPYRTLRRLSDGDPVRPEKAKKGSKSKEGKGSKTEKKPAQQEGAAAKEGS